MSQNIIDTGQAANDGTGEPLRQAFTAINNNFSQIWSSGPVNTNVQITNNKIATIQTNQDLVLSPNGIGNVQANSTIVPGVNSTYDLGTSDRRWDTVWAQYLDVASSVSLPDLIVDGNLTVNGNIIELGNIVTDSKTIQLANTAGNASSANGSGITVGANDNIATLLYNSTSNTWTTNIGLSTGNFVVQGDNIFDLAGPKLNNGDLTHGSTSGLNIVPNGDGNATVLYNTYGNVTIFASSTGANVHTFSFGSDGNLSLPGNVSAVGNISAQYFIGNGSQLTGVTNYSNADVASFLANFGSNTINTTGNISAPDGDGSILINVNGNIGSAIGFNYDRTANTLFAETGSFSGHPETGVQGFYVGRGSYTILGSPILGQFTSDIDSYSQINLQNINSGNLASGDFIVTADNGSDSTYFLDLGLASSNYSYEGYGVIGTNDGYLFVAGADQTGPYTGTANLNIGSTNGAVRTWIGAGEVANIITTVGPDGLSVAGNIIPVTSNVYSLGNSTNQWSDLYVSNATIYMNNIPISLTSGNVLTVAGQPLLSNDSNTSISTTGNITADYFVGDGSQLSNVASTGNLTFVGTDISITSGASETTITISPDPEGWAFLQLPNDDTANVTNTRLTNDAGNVEIVAGDFSTGSTTYSWTFDNSGNLTVPRDVNFSGGSITQIQNEDMYVRVSDQDDDGWALYNVVDNGDPGTVLARTELNRNDFVITTDVQGTGYQWSFDSLGRFNLPNGGNIQGEYGGNSSFFAYDDSNSGSVEIKTISYAGDTLGSNVRVTQSNATISTANAAYTWTFDNTGMLTVPPISTGGEGEQERATIKGTRAIVGEPNTWSTYIPGHTAFGNVAWTSSGTNIQSAKITFVVQSNGTAFNWEQFDVSVCKFDGANAIVSVSNRIRQNSAIDYTEVSAYDNSGNLQVYLNPADGQTSAYINYHAVEFSIMPD